MKYFKITISFIYVFQFLSSFAYAADSIGVTDSAGVKEPVSSSGTDAEQVNVDSIKEKYWARGNETELGVVQNRTFSKKGKIEFSLYGGFLYSDPFLSVKTLGGSVGYHLSEYVSLHLNAYKDLVSPSAALETFQAVQGATVNTNIPNYYVGLEGMGSIFYGKLSVLGKSIIYYDFYFLGGYGMTNTGSGNDMTPSVGFGQRFYLNKFLSIRLDYNLMYYRETIIEQVIPAILGQSRGDRNNFNNVVTLGISFMPFGK